MTPSDIAEKNIRAIYEREQNELDKASRLQKAVHQVAKFSGTIEFAIINAVFFAVWIVCNLTIWKFDPYPFVLLTLIVSLEAIFLSTIVMISQNELARHAEMRHQLDLQVNLLAEQENTAMAKVLIEIAKKLDIPSAKLSELKAMTENTDPEEVLEKIAEVEKENEIR